MGNGRGAYFRSSRPSFISVRPSAAFVASRAFLLAAAVCRGSNRFGGMARRLDAPQRRARASIWVGRQGS